MESLAEGQVNDPDNHLVLALMCINKDVLGKHRA